MHKYIFVGQLHQVFVFYNHIMNIKHHVYKYIWESEIDFFPYIKTLNECLSVLGLIIITQCYAYKRSLCAINIVQWYGVEPVILSQSTASTINQGYNTFNTTTIRYTCSVH
jgi:hypothetical protein